MLPKKNRLVCKSDFKQVFKKGRSFFTPYFVAKCTQSANQPKLAIIVKKSKVALAVQRNFIKRRLRSAFFQFWPSIKKPVDIIVIAEKEASKSDYREIVSAVSKFLKVNKII